MNSPYDKWYHPYTINPEYNTRAAYFCMEYAIDQSLKIYSGGLGYLAGSHLRSAYQLNQNMIAIGMLWKYGYYDQARDENGHLKPQWVRKDYSFLQDTGIMVTVTVNGFPVKVKAMVLPSDVFGTAPLYLLTTDIPENDMLSRTITERLYDGNGLTRMAQSIVLGVGGAKVVEALGGTDIYHLNESHALPLLYHLYEKFQDVEEIKKRFVFTTHTPEKAGNEEHYIYDLDKLTFFGNVPLDKVREISGVKGDMFGHTPAALHFCKIANGVSQLHAVVSKEMWADYEGCSDIIGITNAQNLDYWADKEMYAAMQRNDDMFIWNHKKEKKVALFKEIANQCGKIFDPNILTIVWARRFAGYKRADLILADLARLERILEDTKQPIQIVWAGKPYPLDTHAIEIFNRLVEFSRHHPNMAIVTGYELELSRKLKDAADVWLNTPRMTREASGTSGMSAAMNGAISVSLPDGWIPEFAKNEVNSFISGPTDHHLPVEEQDAIDYQEIMDIIEYKVIPTYYQRSAQWVALMKNAMHDVTPAFESGRMASEYYHRMYNFHYSPVAKLQKEESMGFAG